MIIIDMDMPNSCETCKLQYVCSIYKDVGVIEKDNLHLDRKQHPNCIIKGIADNETKPQQLNLLS